MLKIKNKSVLISIFTVIFIIIFSCLLLINDNPFSNSITYANNDSSSISSKEYEDVEDNGLLPSYYNLRDNITLYTESQNLGLCWAFAGLKSLETFIGLNYGEFYNFSEAYVAYAAAKNYSTYYIGNGGSWFYFVNSAFGLNNKTEYGVLTESYLTNDDVLGLSRNNMHYYEYLESKADYNYDNLVETTSVIDNQANDFSLIKSHITQNGSLSININVDAVVTGTNGHKVSNASSTLINHAVSIIGWDDNFSRLNFPEDIRPSADGAFLILNSWGNDYGDQGIFYMSYEDVYINNKNVYGFKAKENDGSNTFLEFEEVTSINSSYEGYDNINNIFNYNDEVKINYKVKYDSLTDIVINIFDNDVNITTDFTILETLTDGYVNIEITSNKLLRPSTYVIQFDYDGELYYKNFYVIAGAELCYIKSDFGRSRICNSINGQNKTFSVNKWTRYIYGEVVEKYYTASIKVYPVFSLYSKIVEVNIDDEYVFDYNQSKHEYSVIDFVLTKSFYELNVITENGYREVYKIFIIDLFSQSYFINYNLNGGENDILNPRQYNFMQGSYELKNPHKKNCIFDGWYINSIAEDSNIKTLDNSITSSILLVAKWTEFEEIDTSLDFEFFDSNDQLVTDLEDLIYGMQGVFYSDFSFLNEPNLSYKWYLNGSHMPDQDDTMQISLNLLTGNHEVICEAIKSGNVLTYQTALIQIHKKELTVDWGNNLTFVYNSQIQKPNVHVNGLINDDTCDLTILYQLNGQIVENPTNVGEYEASITSLSNENYFISQNMSQINFQIHKKELTIDWGNNLTFVYNSQIQKPNVHVNGLINDDTCDLTILYQLNGQIVENPTNVGEYEASITSLSNENYFISQNMSQINFQIHKKELTIDWGNNLTFVYNSQIQKPNVHVNGLINDDTCDLTILYQLNGQIVENPTNVGEYEASITSLSNENYFISQNMSQTFLINAQTITISAIDVTAKYSENLKNIANNYEMFGTIFENDIVNVTVTTNAMVHVTGTYTIYILAQCENSNYITTVYNGTYTILEGIKVTYILPNKETSVYYLDNNNELPQLDELYEASFGSYAFAKTIYQDDNKIIYEIYNVNIMVIGVISAPIICLFLFVILKTLRKKRYKTKII